MGGGATQLPNEQNFSKIRNNEVSNINYLGLEIHCSIPNIITSNINIVLYTRVFDNLCLSIWDFEYGYITILGSPRLNSGFTTRSP